LILKGFCQTDLFRTIGYSRDEGRNLAQSSVLLSQPLIQLANVLRNTALDLLSGVVEFARNARSLLHERHDVRSGVRGGE